MDFFSEDVFQGQPKEHNLKKELLTGLVTSTVYTFVILGLIQFQILGYYLVAMGNESPPKAKAATTVIACIAVF